MNVYYAHHMWKYNTPIEEHELEVIKAHFPEYKIINPNRDIQQSCVESETIMNCFEALMESDIFVFSTVSGVVGKGVCIEIQFAEYCKMPIYELKDNSLFKTDRVNIYLTNSGNTRAYAVVHGEYKEIF